jgi:hypothetical protein
MIIQLLLPFLFAVPGRIDSVAMCSIQTNESPGICEERLRREKLNRQTIINHPDIGYRKPRFDYPVWIPPRVIVVPSREETPQSPFNSCVKSFLSENYSAKNAMHECRCEFNEKADYSFCNNLLENERFNARTSNAICRDLNKKFRCQ